MYIDNDSEKMFEQYKNQGYDEIYLDNNFKFIKGIQLNKGNLINSENYNNLSDSNSDLVSDSFYEYHEKEIKELNNKNEEENEVYVITDSSEEEDNNNNKDNNNENVIELEETISLHSSSSLEQNNDKHENNNFIINKNKNNLQLNNQTYKIPKKITNLFDKNKLIDLKMEMKINSIKERLKKEMLQRKRNMLKSEDMVNNPKKIKLKDEIVDISSQNSINESSNFIPIDNEIAQQFSTNSN